jgi:hypothetical protein
MSSIPPPSSSQGDRDRADGSTKVSRPRYLVVALVGALVFGAGCWTEGCGRLAFYRGDPEHGIVMNDGIKDEGDRTRADQLYRRFVEVADASRSRSIPLAAATFVLGAALLALAARGLAGRSNTRSALMQVVAAQAVVVCITYFATPSVRNAELDWQLESQLMKQKPTLRPEEYSTAIMTSRWMKSWVPPGWLIVRTLASALIVVALTRQRSREFFEAAGRSVADR